MTGLSTAPHRACVIGWPIKHSRSPLIHTYWLDELGIDGSYTREAVAPDAVDDFFANLAENGFVGCNVTLPHKEAAFRAVAQTDDTARILAAVNTVWLADGVLHGTNTDVYGFLANLDDSAPGWDRSAGRAVILGAGGAARAVVHGLMQRGFAAIDIVNRTRSRAEELVTRFGGPTGSHGWAAVADLIVDADILINTTSLGMAGQPALAIDLKPANENLIVTDIVYTSLMTPLLSAANARGLKTVDGLGMLLHQAVPGFEKWFGRRPVVTEALRRHILADLENSE